MRDEISALTPRLRRYARALVAGNPADCEGADSIVHATLMRAVGMRGLGSVTDLPVRLFATVTQLHRDFEPAQQSKLATGSGRCAPSTKGDRARPVATNRLAGALLALSLDEREALLLVALEGFDHNTASRILRISQPVLFERLTRARTRFAEHQDFIPRQLAVPSKAGVPYLRLVVG